MSEEQSENTLTHHVTWEGCHGPGSEQVPHVKIMTEISPKGLVLGGSAESPGMIVIFQDRPRGETPMGELNAPTGALVENLLLAAKGRLKRYQETSMRSHANDRAIEHVDNALTALIRRRAERAEREVAGTWER